MKRSEIRGWFVREREAPDYAALHPGYAYSIVLVRPLARLLVRRGRDHHHAAVAHAALGNDVVGEMPDLAAGALQRRHLHATVVVEMDMQRRQRQVVIEYYYLSRLPGEPIDGVADRHVHPAEPLAVRL